jgi:hypothetical protein
LKFFNISWIFIDNNGKELNFEKILFSTFYIDLLNEIEINKFDNFEKTLLHIELYPNDFSNSLG